MGISGLIKSNSADFAHRQSICATFGRVALLGGGLHCVPASLHRQERLRRHYVMAIATLDRGASTREGQALSGQAGSQPHLCADHHPPGPWTGARLDDPLLFPYKRPRTSPNGSGPENGDRCPNLLPHNASDGRGRTVMYARMDQKVRGSNPFGRTPLDDRPMPIKAWAGSRFAIFHMDAGSIPRPGLVA